MRMISKLLLIIIFIVVAAGMIGCGQDKAPEKGVVRLVKAIRVADTSGLTKRAFPGRAKAGREVNLSFRVSGPLVVFPAKVGDEVKKGDLLARIDPRDFEVNLRNVQGQLAAARANLAAMKQARPEQIGRLKAAVNKAEATLKRAESDYKREMSIFKELPGATSQTSIDKKLEQKDRAEADLRSTREELRIGEAGARAEDIAAKKAEITSLQASVTAARDQLTYTYLKAPFGGVVVETYVENFETVLPKQPILRVLDPSSIEFTINVPESLIGYAPYVEQINVKFDALPGIEMSAKIKEIGKEASQATRTYPVTLAMAQPADVEILPGMAGEASIVSRPPEKSKLVGIEIPATAVFSGDDPNKSYVWIVDEATKTLSRREVQIGQLARFGVLIKAGLEPGEWIVVKGVHSVDEGQQVRILDAAQAETAS